MRLGHLQTGRIRPIPRREVSNGPEYEAALSTWCRKGADFVKIIASGAVDFQKGEWGEGRLFPLPN